MVRPTGYDVEGYIHFVEMKSGKTQLIGKENVRQMATKDKYELTFDCIESLNLNKVGNEINYTGNVINLERYMLYYWKPIIGSDCILLYLHLWEYCRREDGVDMIFVKMTELMERFQVSRPTLLAKLKKLEEHNFLLVVHRLNKRNNNKEDSPLIKLRMTIPLLTKEQYYTLTPYLQKRHDDYMKKFASDLQMEAFGKNGADTIEDIISNNGDRIISKKVRQEIKTVLKNEEEEEYITSNLPSHMKETLMDAKSFQEALINQGFSKPSAEMFFAGTMVAYDSTKNEVHIIHREKVQREFLEENLNSHRKDDLVKTLIELYESVYEVKHFTAEQYIVTILKGN